MDNHDYVEFPLTTINETLQDEISHEEICEPTKDPLTTEENNLTDAIVDNVDSMIKDSGVTLKIANVNSDEDEKSSIYPIYIKEEEHHNYTSGDDESMAVEALRQLGGMYPCFEEKKRSCERCKLQITQSEISKHEEACRSSVKFSCTTCGENFPRKQDLSNHVVCHQVNRPHACRKCGNLFRSKAHLQNHMTQVHRAEKPHKCTICGSDFNRPSSLSNHMKIHTYVAGRALLQNQTSDGSGDCEKKWPEDETSVTTTNYDVQWSIPYNFDTNVTGIIDNTEKVNNLQEFTVMPNGEVAQFEYSSQDPLNPSLTQYNIGLNNFSNAETLEKLESLEFPTDVPKVCTSLDENTLNRKIHACRHCGANFNRPSALASHEKIHVSKIWSMPVECEYCDKQFQDSSHLSAHQRTCAKKMMQTSVENGTGKWGKHSCGQCGKKFTTKQKMFRHQWIHRKKTHSCEICGSQYEKQCQLDEHRLSAHPGDSPFTCTECGKCFVSRQGLWEHGRTHAGSPAHFHCDTCSKTFSSRQGYLIHHRTHTGERPYGCKFCWKAFRDGGTLRKHERIHTGERPHVCPLCSRAFNQKVVLREHVRWVHAAGKNETETNGPPYPCPLCGALNQDRDELCAHIVKHSDQMIAEAKAKSNDNASKSKETRKKGKSGVTSFRRIEPRIDGTSVKTDETETALLAIADDSTVDDTSLKCEIVDERLTLNDEKNIIGGIKAEVGIVNERSNDQTLVISGQTAIITKIRQSDVLQIIQNAKCTDTLRLVATGGANNTLHLITKQNQSLPVLTIKNPQSHEHFSSQSVGDNATRDHEDMEDCGAQDGRVIDEDTDRSNIQRVEQYLREDQSDDDDVDDEMVCGICGDDFDDKNVLMEHVKIHI